MATDQQLIARVCAGEREVFAQLVERYKARIFHTALRMLRHREEAEEAAQDVFVRAYRGLPKFREEASFSTWIFRICYNVCLSYLERKKMPRADLAEVESFLMPEEDTPERLFENQEFQKLFERAMATLPPKQSSALILFHAQQLSYNEIAEIMAEPVGNVKTHLYRGRAKLREKILQRCRSKNWRYKKASAGV
ncbi:MAG: sigma-70 family RNA polymerase sigma factor [candidate division KSB1 bacterium]